MKAPCSACRPLAWSRRSGAHMFFLQEKAEGSFLDVQCAHAWD